MSQKLVIRKASRKKASLKIGFAAPSGAGKTMSSLLFAFGMMKEKYPNLPDAKLWEKIIIIDTENGSGELYVGFEVGGESNITIGEYAALTLKAPFEPSKYTSAIRLVEDNDFEVCIIDSLTHMWQGQGGALEKQSNIAAKKGNSWTAWKDVTPEINRMIDTILQSDMHILATMRSKTEHVQEKNETGRTVIRKVGMNPIIRGGMEYEFTIFFDVDIDHKTSCSKDRTGLFDGKYFIVSPAQGQEAMKWIMGGSDDFGEVIPIKMSKEDEMKSLVKQVHEKYTELGGKTNDELMGVMKKYESTGNPNNIKTVEELKKLLTEVKEIE